MSVVAQSNSLVGAAAPQEQIAHDVYRVLAQNKTLIEIQIRICEVDRQDRVIVTQIGAKQQRLQAIHQQFKTREITHVGVGVDDRKRISILQRPPRPRDRRNGGNVEQRLAILVVGERRIEKR